MATSHSSPSLRRFFSLMEPSAHLSILPLLLCLFVLFSLSIFLYRKKKKNPTKPISGRLSIFPFSITLPLKRPHQDPSKPFFVQILTSSHSPKWAVPNEAGSDVVEGSAGNSPRANGSEPDLDADAAEEDFGEGGRELKGKRKKKRGKKKRQNTRAEDDGGREEEEGQRENHVAAAGGKLTIECLYPFTSSSSATQRKIKLHYDELVKSNEAKALTMAQEIARPGNEIPFDDFTPSLASAQDS